MAKTSTGTGTTASPLGAMGEIDGEIDGEKLPALLAEIERESAAVDELLAGLNAAVKPRNRHAVDCPNCAGADTRCMRTTKKRDAVIRHRKCGGCGRKFFTEERPRGKKTTEAITILTKAMTPTPAAILNALGLTHGATMTAPAG